MWGQGSGLLLTVPQYCWPGETPGWDQNQTLNRQNLTTLPSVSCHWLLSGAASGSSLPFCWLLTLVCDMSQCP